MTLRVNNCEGTDETVVTLQNSVEGDSRAWSFLPAGPGTYDTAQFYRGSTSIRYVSTEYSRWDGINNPKLRISAYWRWDSDQTGNREFIQLRSPASNNIMGLARSATQRIVLLDGNDTVVASSNIAGHTVTNNNWYRIDVGVICDLSNAATGRVLYRICNVQSGDTNTPITTAYDSTAVVTLRAEVIDRIYVGCAVDTTVGNLWMDSIRIEDSDDATVFMNGMFVDPITDGFWTTGARRI